MKRLPSEWRCTSHGRCVNPARCAHGAAVRWRSRARGKSVVHRLFVPDSRAGLDRTLESHGWRKLSPSAGIVVYERRAPRGRRYVRQHPPARATSASKRMVRARLDDMMAFTTSRRGYLTGRPPDGVERTTTRSGHNRGSSKLAFRFSEYRYEPGLLEVLVVCNVYIAFLTIACFMVPHCQRFWDRFMTLVF